jgi:hypothetical protein
MIGPCQFCKPHEQQGADRERRRIRRAQREALVAIGAFSGWNESRVTDALNVIDAATRAPKKGRK